MKVAYLLIVEGKLFVYYTFMDYLTELLKSYDKLKKRKLKLLKESDDPDAESKASQAFQQATQLSNSGKPPNLAQPFVTDGGKNQVAIYQKKDGSWKGSIFSNGKVLGGKNEVFIEQEWERFVGFFKGEGVSNAGYEKSQPGEFAGASEALEGAFEQSEKVTDNLLEMAVELQGAFTNLGGEKTFGKSYAQFTTFFFGSSNQSLERHLVNSKIKIQVIKDSEGNSNYVGVPTQPDPNTIEEVSKNLLDLVKVVSKQDLKGFEDIKGRFAINKDTGHVTVFSEGNDSGLVFQDQNGFFKLFLKAAESKFGQKVRAIEVLKEVSEIIDNHMRGSSMEDVLTILAMQKQIKKGRTDPNLIQSVTQLISNDLLQRLQKLRMAKESWVAIHSQSALEPEDIEIINAVSTMLGEGGFDLVSALFQVSRDALKNRSPDFILSKAREVGEGRRQDTFEVYSNEQEGIQALLNMGYHLDEVRQKGLIKPIGLEELFQTNPRMYKYAIQSGIFQKGQMVFYTPVSLKNYMDLENVNLGHSEGNSTSDFIQGNSKDPNNLNFKKFQEISGIRPDQHERAKSYNKSLDDIDNKIQGLETLANVRTENGNFIRKEPFKEFVETCLNTFLSESTYKELKDDNSIKGKLFRMCRRFVDDKDLTNEQAIDRIKTYTSQFIRNIKTVADLQKGSEEAKYYVAMKLFNTGGSFDDGLMVDFRGLTTRESHNFLQNNLIREVVQEHLLPDDSPFKRWGLNARNNTFQFYRKDNPKIRVTLFDKTEKGFGGGFVNRSNVQISKDLLVSYSRKNRKVESVIEAFLKDQKKALELILAEKEFVR